MLPSLFGETSVSLLQRFDSGTPYEMKGWVRPPVIENPGYVNPPNQAAYYFTERGAFRWDEVTATDLAFRLALPVRRAEAFIQADVINLFDESAQMRGNTTVQTAFDDPSLAPFDPPVASPQEGVHYRKGKQFGQAQSAFDYQQPRTFQMSAGFRF